MKDFYEFKPNKNVNFKMKGPEVEFSIIRRLGKPKFWVSENDFDKVMKLIYLTASKGALSGYQNNSLEQPEHKV